jgi:hypothetical protein
MDGNPFCGDKQSPLGVGDYASSSNWTCEVLRSAAYQAKPAQPAGSANAGSLSETSSGGVNAVIAAGRVVTEVAKGAVGQIVSHPLETAGDVAIGTMATATVVASGIGAIPAAGAAVLPSEAGVLLNEIKAGVNAGLSSYQRDRDLKAAIVKGFIASGDYMDGLSAAVPSYLQDQWNSVHLSANRVSKGDGGDPEYSNAQANLQDLGAKGVSLVAGLVGARSPLGLQAMRGATEIGSAVMKGLENLTILGIPELQPAYATVGQIPKWPSVTSSYEFPTASSSARLAAGGGVTTAFYKSAPSGGGRELPNQGKKYIPSASDDRFRSDDPFREGTDRGITDRVYADNGTMISSHTVWADSTQSYSWFDETGKIYARERFLPDGTKISFKYGPNENLEFKRTTFHDGRTYLDVYVARPDGIYGHVQYHNGREEFVRVTTPDGVTVHIEYNPDGTERSREIIGPD